MEWARHSLLPRRRCMKPLHMVVQYVAACQKLLWARGLPMSASGPAANVEHQWPTQWCWEASQSGLRHTVRGPIEAALLVAAAVQA